MVRGSARRGPRLASVGVVDRSHERVEQGLADLLLGRAPVDLAEGLQGNDALRHGAVSASHAEAFDHGAHHFAGGHAWGKWKDRMARELVKLQKKDGSWGEDPYITGLAAIIAQRILN